MFVYTIELINSDTSDGIVGVYSNYKLAVNQCKKYAEKFVKLDGTKGKLKKQYPKKRLDFESFFIFKDEDDVYFRIQKFKLDHKDLINHY